MKMSCLTVTLLLCATVAFATPIYTATHLGSDAGYVSFLQFGNDDRRVSFFTNRLHVNRSVTHDLEGLKGDFSIFVVNTQQRYTLDDPRVRQMGDTYSFEDKNDNDFNDFRFTLKLVEDPITGVETPAHSPAAVPEPATWMLMATGLVGLWAFKRRRVM